MSPGLLAGLRALQMRGDMAGAVAIAPDAPHVSPRHASSIAARGGEAGASDWNLWNSQQPELSATENTSMTRACMCAAYSGGTQRHNGRNEPTLNWLETAVPRTLGDRRLDGIEHQRLQPRSRSRGGTVGRLR
jgi:hypothetical protein